MAHGVSYSTAYYWINDEARAKQRAKVAKRTHPPGDKSRIKRDQNKRQQNWRADPEMRLRHNIQSAKDEKRLKRKTVAGMKMEEAEDLLKSGQLQRRNRKMD